MNKVVLLIIALPVIVGCAPIKKTFEVVDTTIRKIIP